MIKKLAIGVLILALLAGIGVMVFISNFNKLVKVGVEESMSYVLEVPVTIDKIKVSPFSGAIAINGFHVGNPAGYKTDSAFSFDEIKVQADLKSFTTNTPIVNLVSISSPKVTLEQGLRGSNLSTLIASAGRFSSGGSGGDAPHDKEKEVAEDESQAPQGAQISMSIEQVILEGCTASISSPILQGKEASITLPRIEISNLGGPNAKVTVAESMQILLGEILKSTLEAGQDILPSDLLAGLGGSDIGETVEALKESGKAIGDSLKDTGDSLKEEGKALKEGLKGLFGKKKGK